MKKQCLIQSLRVNTKLVSDKLVSLSVNEPKWLVLIFAIFLVLFLIVRIHYTGKAIGSDGLGYYAHLRSAVVDGDLHYANEFLEYNWFGHYVPDPYQRTVTDHVPNKFFVGPAILWAPFFLVAHTLTIQAVNLGFKVVPNGYSVLYQFFIGLGSITYGLLGLILIYRILLRFFQRNEALFASVLIIFSTNVLYYLTTESTMSHAMSLFAVSLFAYLWMKDLGNRTYRSVLLLGASAGLMTLIRPQDMMFSIVIVMEWLGIFKRDSHVVSSGLERIKQMFLFGVIFLIMLIPQFIVWKILYGQFIFYSYSSEGFNFLSPHLLDTLFSAHHGLISWTPVILAALVGLGLFCRKQPKIGAALLTAFALQWYLNASWWCWWFAISFGNRAYVSCSFIFAIGLAAILSETKKWTLTVRLISVALIGWNLLFISQYSLGILPRDEPVRWKQVLINQYEVVGKGIKFLSSHSRVDKEVMK
jgi:hypothetical protein